MGQIFGTPKYGWCHFQLGTFTAGLSYLTDVMYDTLAMCLDYLQTGGGTVQYDTPEEHGQYEKNEGGLFSDLTQKIRKLLNKTSYWAEIQCDYFDEEDQVWVVDAWKTEKEDEENIAVAKIAKNGAVTYLDERAKTDAYVQDVIRMHLANPV